jgi:ribosomal protein S18 acetylase RimI-like enzyme
MQVRSLGYRTDLFFAGYSGEITDCGDYLVIRTPSNPTFYWGNYLLFPRPPGSGDERRWRRLFQGEIGPYPEIAHQAFGWDSVSGDLGVVQPFLNAGFRLNRAAVLTAGHLKPVERTAEEVTMLPLSGDDDWAQALENQIDCRDPEHEETGYRVYKQRQMDGFRQMAGAGMGTWYGAFVGPRLVGDLGIFHSRAVGRYQSVGVHPDFRRRGIGRSLVVQSGRHALENFGLQTLVIVADLDSAAQRLYQAAGFEKTELQVGLEWWLPPPGPSQTVPGAA